VEAAMSIEAMKMALEALERHKPKISEGSLPVLTHDAAITALRAAIEQSEKPVAWQGVHDYTDLYYRKPPQADVRPLYTAPRQEQYDQTSLELCETCGWKAMIPGEGCLVCARQKAKPAAWVYPEFWDHLKQVNCGTAYRSPDDGMQPLYAAPRQWVGLTEDEIHHAFCYVEYETPNDWNADPERWCQQFARYLEQRLKEKNHAD
jgi:hypothetical protein